MEGKRVLILVLNEMQHDTRVIMQGKTLAQNGATVQTYALHGNGLKIKEGTTKNCLIRIPLKSRKLSKGRKTQVFKWLEYLLWSIKLSLKFHPNVVHSNDWKTLWSGWIISKMNGAKLVYDSHEYWEASLESVFYPKWLRFFQLQIERRLGLHANALISVCSTMVAEIEKSIPNKNTFIVHNSWLSRKSDVPRNPQGWTGKVPLKLLYLGALAPGRGLEALIYGILKVDNVDLDIVGYGHAKSMLMEISKSNGASKRVRFLPPVPYESIPSLTNQYDMGVYPYPSQPKSMDLTVPNKLFEYAGGGLGILSSSTMGMNSWIKRYNAGILFEAGNIESVEKSLLYIQNHSEMVKVWQSGAIQIAKIYSRESAQEELLDVYRSLIK